MSAHKIAKGLAANHDSEASASAALEPCVAAGMVRPASSPAARRHRRHGPLLVLLAGFALSMSLAGCLPATGIQQGLERQALDWTPEVRLTLAQAEQILGEPAHLSDQEAFVQKAIRTYNSAYLANAPDQASGKTGALYFMLEEYPEPVAAAAAYTAIWQANQAHAGIEPFEQAGDQAYFHTDKQNFLFILARKRNLLIRIKVNKVTSRTSSEAFLRVSRLLANTL